VARLARKRIEAIAERESRASEADAMVAELEALATRPGPILTLVIELNRRWQSLDLSEDPVRLARCEAARQVLQARFDREHEEQRARARFERRLTEWLAITEPPAAPDELTRRREELAELREEGAKHGDAVALSRLEEAGQRIEQWAQELEAIADAEVLVIEAEQLAASTSIDNEAAGPVAGAG
jgi:hypothetical protein